MKKLLIIGLFVCGTYLNLSAQANNVSLNAIGKYVEETGILFNGNLETAYLSGKTECIYEITDGVKDGKVAVYFENGSLKESGNYNVGKKNGEWVSYNQDGKIASIAFYRNDVKHGTWKICDDKGVVRSIQQYNNGKRTGTWKSFDAKGKLTESVTY